MNEEKSEAIWLGSAKQSTSKPLGIKWPGVVKVLGIYISYDTDKSIKKNYSEKINNMKQKLTMWRRRNLTIAGKILILKTFGISQILYLSSVLSVPEWALKEINKTMNEFLWNGKHNKVKANVVIQNIERGGYNMCDLESMCKIQHIKWVKKYFDKSEASWKFTFASLMKNINLNYFLMSDYSEGMIPQHSVFYKDMLKTLNEVRKKSTCASDMFNEILWYNRHILRSGQPLYSSKLAKAGLYRVHDVIDHNANNIPFQLLAENIKAETNILFWNGLIRSIPRSWKNLIKIENRIIGQQSFIIPIEINSITKDLTNVNLKLLYEELVRKKLDVSKANVDYSNEYNINDEKWKLIYKLPHTIKISNKIKELQYKILHGYVATNKLLYKIKQIGSPRCDFCFLYTQTIKHLFF